jgi:glycosyltransferase involved in cell wall biosynthesis
MHSAVRENDTRKPIKILVVDAKYPPDHTGSGLRVHRTYKRLQKSYPVEIIALTFSSIKGNDNYEIFDGIPVYRIKWSRSFLILFARLGKYYIKHNLRHVDIVHGVGASLLVIIATLWAKILDLKIIREKTVTIKGDSNYWPIRIKRLLNYPRYYFWLNYSYRIADLLIAINGTIKNYYTIIGIDDKRIWLRPNPVDIAKYYPAPNKDRVTIRQKLGITKDTYVCLTVGQFEPRKNQKIIIDIAKVVCGKYLFLLIGPIDYQNKIYYKSIAYDININKLHNKVKLIPEFRNDLEIFYQAADTLIIPSFNEGTPNVMLEALCCGVSVLVNKNLHLESYIVDGVNGFNVRPIPEEIKYFLDIIKNNRDSMIIQRIADDAKKRYNSNRIDEEQMQKINNMIQF